MIKGWLIRLLVTLAIGAAVAVFSARWLSGPVPTSVLSARPPAGAALLASNAAIGGAFSLVDQAGQPVTEKSYAGHWRLMFFGYTFCPDICPTELQVMAQAMDLLGPAGDQVQPLFISVDPQRDTPAQLADYVAQFHPRLAGLTGTPEQVAAAVKAWGVYAAKAAGTDPENYLMDHSTYIYLMDPDNHLVSIFDRGTSAADMAAAIQDRLANCSAAKPCRP